MTTTNSDSKARTGASPKAADATAGIVRAVQCEPAHELEREVAELATFYMNSAIGGASGWAWERIPVRASFFVGDAQLFRYALDDPRLGENRKVHARANLHFNIGYLVQNHVAYLEHIVPECIARLLDAITRYSQKNGGVAKPHRGDTPSWAIWHKQLTGREPLTPEATKRLFSKVPALLLAGHTLGECKCDGAQSRWHALDSAQLLRVGQGTLRCDHCREPIVRASDSRRPAWISDEVQFLASRSGSAPAPTAP
ncbi:hypothetical protein E4T66_17950 [Sinimarinibacterium sp. CAU 1509]|uniref:hypothetical protein n=1 Tax=Sinimarinibacterium sp. CAU 1509 TaxID=2562283 RepID=UPI0010AB6E9A|nr:hypothetical protein [Sinimarinibacterium sp. CAU 1509]TJY57289.1 hypothetical protein E4T66_17950 [Sinimarinibacterium sp. CAU 1509]